jgi:hypothetical protein
LVSLIPWNNKIYWYMMETLRKSRFFCWIFIPRVSLSLNALTPHYCKTSNGKVHLVEVHCVLMLWMDEWPWQFVIRDDEALLFADHSDIFVCFAFLSFWRSNSRFCFCMKSVKARCGESALSEISQEQMQSEKRERKCALMNYEWPGTLCCQRMQLWGSPRNSGPCNSGQIFWFTAGPRGFWKRSHRGNSRSQAFDEPSPCPC